MTKQLNDLFKAQSLIDNIDKKARKVKLLQKNNQISDRDKEFLQSLADKDVGRKVFRENQKLLDELIALERNLTIQEKVK